MKYDQILDLPFEGESTEQLTTNIAKFEEGQEIVGKLLEVNDFSSSRFTAECLQYVVQTDRGKISFIMGGGTDKQIEGRLKPGMIVYFKFNGKQELSDGRSFNNWTVIDVTRLYEMTEAKISGSK